MKLKIAFASIIVGSFLLSCGNKDCFQCQLPDETYLDEACSDQFTDPELVSQKETCKALGGTWYYNGKPEKN